MKFGGFARKFTQLLICAAGLSLMSGCASNFVRPEQNVISLGKSTSEEVAKATQGNPIQQKNIKINNEQIDLLTYNFIEGAKFWGMIIPHRTLTYSFFNNVLIGEEFNSTYDGERTEFDTTKIGQIQKGQTQEQVVAILGKPSGKVLYPLVTDKTGYGLVYAYSYARFAPVVSPSFSYLLIITFDANNAVTQVSYKENGKEVVALK